jgi:hypothetical protein
VSELDNTVARAMWAAAHVNPTLPVPLPFDELADGDRGALLAMARAAIAVLGDERVGKR